MDLTPAALAAQAREIWQRALDTEDPIGAWEQLREDIAAALGAVCAAARAERDAEIAHVVADHETEHAMQESYIEDLIKERDQRVEDVRRLREALEAAHARNIRWQQKPEEDPVDALTEILDITGLALAPYLSRAATGLSQQALRNAGYDPLRRGGG